MRFLIDTNVAIWSIAASDRLPSNVRDILENTENSIYVSAASLFEIGIKARLRRKSAPPFTAQFAHDQFRAVGFEILAVTGAHTVAVETLELDHGDPFDRLILAQALTEPLRLITKDRELAAYSDMIISW
jgi:PIN domain nuclease of toxin-antitoxin system